MVNGILLEKSYRLHEAMGRDSDLIKHVRIVSENGAESLQLVREQTNL